MTRKEIVRKEIKRLNDNIYVSDSDIISVMIVQIALSLATIADALTEEGDAE